MVYEMKDVSVSFGEQKALNRINCTIQDGKWISIIGRTGAGKSTFAKVLKGLIPHIEGEYRIHDHPVPTDKRGSIKVIHDIGFVFQYPEHQIFETTVYNELAFGPKNLGYSLKQIESAIEFILPLLSLSKSLLPLSPYLLSGGEKRRIALASVMIMDPKLIILDEPTAGLDPLNRLALLQVLKDWQQKSNRTVLFISHNMEDVAEFSDEVMVFNQGQLLAHLNATTLFLEQVNLLEQAGLALPEHVQLLKLIEEISGEKIEMNSCQEKDIIHQIKQIPPTRGLIDAW